MCPNPHELHVRMGQVDCVELLFYHVDEAERLRDCSQNGSTIRMFLPLPIGMAMACEKAVSTARTYFIDRVKFQGLICGQDRRPNTACCTGNARPTADIDLNCFFGGRWEGSSLKIWSHCGKTSDRSVSCIHSNRLFAAFSHPQIFCSMHRGVDGRFDDRRLAPNVPRASLYCVGSSIRREESNELRSSLPTVWYGLLVFIERNAKHPRSLLSEPVS